MRCKSMSGFAMEGNHVSFMQYFIVMGKHSSNGMQAIAGVLGAHRYHADNCQRRSFLKAVAETVFPMTLLRNATLHSILRRQAFL